MNRNRCLHGSKMILSSMSTGEYKIESIHFSLIAKIFLTMPGENILLLREGVGREYCPNSEDGSLLSLLEYYRAWLSAHLRRLRVEFSKNVLIQALVFASKDCSPSVVEPSDSIFALTGVYASGSFFPMPDNQAAFRIYREQQGIINHSYKMRGIISRHGGTLAECRSMELDNLYSPTGINYICTCVVCRACFLR